MLDGAPPRAAITVVLAVRKGLRRLVDCEPGMRVVGEAGTVPDAVRVAKASRPDVLVLDPTIASGSGLKAIPMILEKTAGTAIVVVTLQTDPSLACQALRSGALGLVLEQAADDELPGAVRVAAGGESYLSPRVGALLATQSSGPAGPPADLSDRELEVLRLIALGHTNAEIAGRLYLSIRTIESHRAHIQHKTRRASRAELVHYALEHRLVQLLDA